MYKLFILSCFLLSFNVFSAPTGILTLQGQVAEMMSIVVTQLAGHDSLDLSATPANLKVAEVAESSNSATGYEITVTSANTGFLKNGTLDQLEYTMRYDGVAVDLSAADTVKDFASTVVDYISDVDISYTGKPAASMAAGTYSDTVTVTISAM